MERKLNEQESLAIINEMIDRARNNVQKGSATSLIYNGYAVVIVAILNFTLLHLLPKDYANYSFIVWWLMLPSAIIDHFLKRKIDRSSIVKTQIDGIISAIWKAFGVSIILLLVILFSMAYSWIALAQEPRFYYFAAITPVIMLMTGMAEFAMAKACRYKPFMWGAVCFWIGAVLCMLFAYILVRDGSIQFLVLAACMIAGFIVPGHKLNKLARNNV
jgi:hypothetical protein